MLTKVLLTEPSPATYTCGQSPSKQVAQLNSNYVINKQSRFKAFTLIELLITVAILTISISIAIPSFNAQIEKTKLKSTAVNLQSTLMQARNHAISNRVMVIVCQANGNNYDQCSPRRKRYDNWQNGWISYADLNNNNELDVKDRILSVHQATSKTAVVFNQVGRLRFFPMGSARSAGFYMCSSNSSQTQYIRLLHTGRSRLSEELSPKQLLKCQNQIKS